MKLKDKIFFNSKKIIIFVSSLAPQNTKMKKKFNHTTYYKSTDYKGVSYPVLNL